jgi:hypothetical protein
MESQPVKRSETPGYPTRREVLAGAAGFVLAGMAGAVPGCNKESSASAAVQTVVAPLFDHGEGLGATGCMVIRPPVFLSEEEGMQVIREELVKYGIELGQSKSYENILVPHRELEEVVKEKNGENVLEEKIVDLKEGGKPLRIDGIDQNKKIAVEFISAKDYFDLGGPQSKTTAQPYYFKKVAELLRTQIKNEGMEQLHLGLFYDPTETYNLWGKRSEPVEKTQNKCKEKSKELLRQQAQDFVAWLKKEKVI